MAELAGRCSHNYRENISANVKQELVHKNRYSKRRNPLKLFKNTWNKVQGARVSAGARKMRNTTVQAVELVLGASSEFFEGKSQNEIDEWVKLNVAWAGEYYKGRGKIAGFALHMDEATPHLHILMAPITRKRDKTTGKSLLVYSAKEFVGNKSEMNRARSSHAEAMQTKYPLERGRNYYKDGETPPDYIRNIKDLRRDTIALEKELENCSIEDMRKFESSIPDLPENTTPDYHEELSKAYDNHDKKKILKMANNKYKLTPPNMRPW